MEPKWLPIIGTPFVSRSDHWKTGTPFNGWRISFAFDSRFAKTIPMQFEIDGKDNDQAYKLLSTLITPRPIAWVTTVNDAGIINAAPYSFFNVFGTQPPIVAFAPGNRSSGKPKDTAANIAATGEFVVNLVDEATAEAMHLTSASEPSEVNELDVAGLNTIPSERIKPPRIAEAPASMECTVYDVLTIGENRLVIGYVHLLHVRDGVLDPETLRLIPDAYPIIGRMFGSGYTKTRERFDLELPE
ncbi:MAG: flavin reductase (DIM6/NTAB) family NADH-FMN oxidoreductase RutF [Kiritimatiellia bacterium]|jgi:flavin reductase (DIM6/NTAB) family NADH-FMN oxidoreductase RutF